MTSQRDETTHAPAGEEITDDPIIIERRDEVPGGGSLEGDGPAAGIPGDGVPAGGVPAGGIPAGDGMAEDEAASDELTGRHAAPDTGGSDPGPLAVPPDVPRAGTGGSYGSGPATGTGSDVPGSDVPGSDVPGSAVPGLAVGDSAVAGSEAAGSEMAGSAVPGPAAAPDAAAATAQPGVDGIPDPILSSPVGAGTGDAAAGTAGDSVPAAALSEQQWPAIQAMFVDDPAGSVQRAAAAAEEVAKAFVASLRREQADLRASWENGGDTTTEDLRTALQQYRAFCGRLEGLAS